MIVRKHIVPLVTNVVAAVNIYSYYAPLPRCKQAWTRDGILCCVLVVFKLEYNYLTRAMYNQHRHLAV